MSVSVNVIVAALAAVCAALLAVCGWIFHRIIRQLDRIEARQHSHDIDLTRIKERLQLDRRRAEDR